MAAKKRQQLTNRPIDLSHMTRPRLDPLVQQTLESVGMRTRKALSDAQYKKEAAMPSAQAAMKMAIASNAESIAKPLPFYEVKSANDPWAMFKEAGRKAALASSTSRVAKRSRDDDDPARSGEPVVSSLTSAETSVPLLMLDDPNDMEFTNPPWLASQESLQSDDDMAE